MTKSSLLPNDGGISVLVILPALDKLGSFADHLSTPFLEYTNALPGVPPIRRGHLVGKIVGTKHFSTTLTEPVGNGFALIGDAAATNDPLGASDARGHSRPLRCLSTPPRSCWWR
ncbi:hypothetical protein [Rhodococcus sp. IEGM 1318]|uniref:hypothetical protein n=1 Tax=Rhodococcus sp. IEGM 1318 TaxID=3082226 RepID=UPI00295528B6|nr:hypothetical protein [Rhodococcus sp. IEGM 1318]MDV8004803.1 hypothetical protein [Rhodococcus sp. IEGM 1318]